MPLSLKADIIKQFCLPTERVNGPLPKEISKSIAVLSIP